MIKINYDNNSEMLSIERDGEFVFMGNYSDLPDTPSKLATLLDNLGVESILTPVYIVVD